MAALVTFSKKAQRFMNIAAATAEFEKRIVVRETEAAIQATAESRNTFTSQLSGRPLAPTRFGRPTTQGKFASYISWSRTRTGGVALDISNLRDHAPYVFIQEIGTGQNAKILNPPGSVEVVSQAGREISARLFWAAGPGMAGTAATAGIGSEQLYLMSDLSAVPNTRKVRGRKSRIKREIKGKHFIQKGGALGFRTLANGLTSDAKRIFQ